MQGVFIYGSRPPTKRYLIAQVEEVNRQLKSGSPLTGADPYSVVIEATSMFGDEFDGSLAQAYLCMEQGHEHDEPPCHPGPFQIVGPDPRTSRKWYATLEYNTEKGEWVVR